MALAALSMAACSFTMLSQSPMMLAAPSQAPLRSTASVMIFDAQRRRFERWLAVERTLKAMGEMQQTVNDIARDLSRVQDACIVAETDEGLEAISACISPLLDAHLDLYDEAQTSQQAQLIRRQSLIDSQEPFESINAWTNDLRGPVLELQRQRAEVHRNSTQVAIECVSRTTNLTAAPCDHMVRNLVQRPQSQGTL